MRRLTALLSLALPLLLAGCNESPTAPKIEETTFDPSLEIDLSQFNRTVNGLYFRDLAVGTGATAASGNTVDIRYGLYLTNGLFLGDNNDDEFPFTFVINGALGTTRAIAGMELGVTWMKVGGTRQLIIPPELGYGDRANGPIPPNSILVFTVTLEAIH